MGMIASQITSLTIVYSNVYSDGDQRKYQSSASLAFVRGIHRRPVNSPHKWPVTRKMFPFDDVIMIWCDIVYITAVTEADKKSEYEPSKGTPYFALASPGLSFVWIVKKIYRVMTAPHCTTQCIQQIYYGYPLRMGDTTKSKQGTITLTYLKEWMFLHLFLLNSLGSFEVYTRRLIERF